MPGTYFVAEGANRRWGWADPGQAGVNYRLGEIGILGKKTITGMDSVGAGLLGGSKNFVDYQVALSGGAAAEGKGLVG